MSNATSDVVQDTDMQVGRVLALLDQLGNLNSTLIMVTSDSRDGGEGGPRGFFNFTPRQPVRTGPDRPHGRLFVGRTPGFLSVAHTNGPARSRGTIYRIGCDLPDPIPATASAAPVEEGALSRSPAALSLRDLDACTGASSCACRGSPGALRAVTMFDESTITPTQEADLRMHHTHEPTAVANLLYRYAEYIDTGDFDGAAALFERATIWARPAFGAPAREISHKELREHWQNVTVLHDDGTPRTKHLITNPIIEIAEDEATASIRSYYTVLHALDQFPLQPIAAGRYHDRFARDADRWYFTYRDYTLMDLRGDLSTHLASSWEARES